MGVLAPLFLAGLAALSLPVLFHLVRRTPRGRQPFSSLMFLVPTPPRLTRRSRLDQVLLLLMRLAALALLAFAFARPFLRQSALLSIDDLPRRRVALLVDTSASMRRGDLWQQAIAQAEKELDELAAHDDVALFTFSDRLDTVVGFDNDAATGAARTEVLRQALRKLQPTWRSGDLGSALTSLAGELDAASDVRQSLSDPRIVLISDLQKGNRIESLQASPWPERVHVVPRVLPVEATTNAHARLLVADDDSADDAPRVRVASAANSSGDQFYLSWRKEGAAEQPDETAVYVPPGQSRVVRLPRPKGHLLADRVVLRGDSHEFDNTLYVAPPRRQEVTLLYVGDDAADDPQGMRYFLELAVGGDPLRKVTMEVEAGDEPPELEGPAAPALIVATKAAPAAWKNKLVAYVERGGMLVLAPKDDEAARSVANYVDGVELAAVDAQEGDDGDADDEFALLGEIDFSHWLFAPFAHPKYNDFTRIHFWRHRRLRVKDSAGTQVVARFDRGDPWLVDRLLGEGHVIVLASGWHPEESQLAVSSKFVPLVGGLLDQAAGSTQPLASVSVGESIALPREAGRKVVIKTPDGRSLTLAKDETQFRAVDQPGIYTATIGERNLHFAVNVPRSESDTDSLPLEQLEQLGVRLADKTTRAEQLSKMRQQQAAELESRQKLWRWMLVACLGILTVETWWSARAARQSVSQAEDVA